MVTTTLNTGYETWWSLEQALTLIRTVQPFAQHAGYHLALAGGVLNRGSSHHDLDIVVMPLRDDRNRSLNGLWRAFGLCGVEQISDLGPHYPHESHRTLWRGFMGGKVIDLFVYGEPEAAAARPGVFKRILKRLRAA
jgi:hypothetical protein